jgi:hypothetical protein
MHANLTMVNLQNSQAAFADKRREATVKDAAKEVAALKSALKAAERQSTAAVSEVDALRSDAADVERREDVLLTNMQQQQQVRFFAWLLRLLSAFVLMVYCICFRIPLRAHYVWDVFNNI